MTETDIPFDALLNDAFDRADRKRFKINMMSGLLGEKWPLKAFLKY